MFYYKNNNLFADNVKLATLATQFGTPLYVYSATDIKARCKHLKKAFSALNPHIHYSVKANSNLSILRLFHQQGISFDVVSGGELARLQAANIPVNTVGFAGVGKTSTEIEQALKAKIGFFNVESSPELARLAQLATVQQCQAKVLLRLNPDVNPQTHKYITTGQATNKFGLDFETAATLYQQYLHHPWTKIVGFHTHLGSQIQQIEPYITATKKILAFIKTFQTVRHSIEWLNLGGGFAIDYHGNQSLSLSNLAEALTPLLHNQTLKLILEPGRSLIARAGLLLMKVEYIKKTPHKNFIIADAGMHTMIRPALYGGWHKIWPINHSEQSQPLLPYDVVGPICESTDFLAQDRLLPPIQAGDILALFDAGAYGFTMTSNYNSHPRPAEVLVDDDHYHLIRPRESYHDLMTSELAFLEKTSL